MKRKRGILLIMTLMVVCLSAECAFGAMGPLWGKDVTDRKLNKKNGTPYGIGWGRLVCTTYCSWAVHKYYKVKGYPDGGFVRTHKAWMAANAKKVCSIRSPSQYARKHRKIRPGDIVCFNTGYNFSGVWMHIAIIGGDRKTLHHAVSTGVSYRYTLYGWLTYLDQAKSCKVYRLTKGKSVGGNVYLYHPPEKIKGKRVKVRYLKTGRIRTDIRKLMINRRIRKWYRTTQGACSDGQYIYMSYVKKRNRYKYARIIKFDMDSRRIVRISRRLRIGHANDLTYLPDQQKILATHSSVGKRKRLFIHVISPDTLEITGRIRIRIPRNVRGATQKRLKHIRAFSSIAYDPYSDRIYLKVQKQRAYLRLDRNYNVKSYFRTQKKYRHLVTQTITFNKKYLIRTQSLGQTRNCNVITYFTRNGKYVKTIRPKFRGEIEGIFYHGNRLFATIHKKKYVRGRLVVKTNIVEIKK